MAATAVYASVAPVALDGSGRGDSFAVANTSADATFTITVPGLYMVNVIGSTFGTVALQVLGPDGSTYVPVDIMTGTATVTAGTVQGVAASFAANGTGLAYLSAGKYRFHLA